MVNGLGRIAHPDPRDAGYPMRAVLPATGARWRYWWDNGAWFDQGATGTCVGHGWAHFVEDSPITHPNENVDPFAWYHAATLLDAWPDNDSPNDDMSGTSVRAGAKVGVGRGLWAQYRWAADARDVVDAVLTTGPVVIGIDWYEDMFDPSWERDDLGDRRLMVVPGGALAGGHCLVVNGASLDRGTVRLKNSWGRGWGIDGRASMRIGDLDTLLQADGEACIAVERAV